MRIDLVESARLRLEADPALSVQADGLQPIDELHLGGAEHRL